MVALATHYAGLFSNDDRLAEQLLAAGLATQERLWRMPLGKEYDKMIDSKFADMAYFLQQIANAVPVAALYAALAFGYAIAFAVTRRADLTYGALFAFAGQIFVLFSDVGWNRLWLVLPAALGLGAAAAVTFGLGAGLVAGRYVMTVPRLARWRSTSPPRAGSGAYAARRKTPIRRG